MLTLVAYIVDHNLIKCRNKYFKHLLPGPSRRLDTGHKMQTVSVFFQRYIVRDISVTEIYRWLIEILSAILNNTRHGGQSRERL